MGVTLAPGRECVKTVDKGVRGEMYGKATRKGVSGNSNDASRWAGDMGAEGSNSGAADSDQEPAACGWPGPAETAV